MLHVTPPVLVLLTVAVMVCVWLLIRLAELGATVTPTATAVEETVVGLKAVQRIATDSVGLPTLRVTRMRNRPVVRLTWLRKTTACALLVSLGEVARPFDVSPTAGTFSIASSTLTAPG